MRDAAGSRPAPEVLRVASFNVNGIRAAQRRGFEAWLARRRPDILGLQEMRCPAEAVPTGVFTGYHLAYHAGVLPGRNGVAIASRIAPSAVRTGFGHRIFDPEGRYLEVDLDPAGGPALTVASLYLTKGAPRTGREANVTKYERKMAFLAVFGAYLVRARRDARRRGRSFLVMGDFNIAHTRTDLSRWQGASQKEGFLPEERAWFSSMLGDRTLVDVVRRLHPDQAGPYTWWSWLASAFERDAGWRIDYQLASPDLARAALVAGTDRDTHADARISDHAPVVVDYAWK